MQPAERRDDRSRDTDKRPQVELYDPFDMNFLARRRDDPLVRLYDKKIINDDF